MWEGGTADLQMSFLDEDLIGWIGLNVKAAAGCEAGEKREEQA
jgi:hypothetical protein